MARRIATESPSPFRIFQGDEQGVRRKQHQADGCSRVFLQRFSRKQYFIRFDASRHSAREAPLVERRGKAGESRTAPLKLETGAVVLLSNNFGEMFRLELALRRSQQRG